MRLAPHFSWGRVCLGHSRSLTNRGILRRNFTRDTYEIAGSVSRDRCLHVVSELPSGAGEEYIRAVYPISMVPIVGALTAQEKLTNRAYRDQIRTVHAESCLKILL